MSLPLNKDPFIILNSDAVWGYFIVSIFRGSIALVHKSIVVRKHGHCNVWPVVPRAYDLLHHGETGSRDVSKS